MGSIGGRKALQVCENVEKILAIELLCAAQAFDFRKPLKSSALLDKVHAYVREHITHALEDRIFGDDMNKAIEIVKSRALLDIAAKYKTTAYSEFDPLFESF